MPEYVLGIDLGTSTTVASVVKDGFSQVIPLTEDGKASLPSVVSFYTGGKGFIIGEEAKRLSPRFPNTTVFSIKRIIGKKFSHDDTKMAISRYPFTVVESQNDSTAVDIEGRHFSPQEICSFILKRVKEAAERFVGEPVTSVVLTVPANFNEAQRRATKMAGTMAGLDVLRIVNEPTAAALSYGFGNRLDEKIAVFDFGGGTFDITILEVRDNFFEVLSSDGDSFLGGDDIDATLVEFIYLDIENRYGVDARGSVRGRSLLRRAAEQAKKELSFVELTTIEVGELPVDETRSIAYSLDLSRELFEEIVHPIIQRTFRICSKALDSAHLKKQDIDAVILVGGSSKAPAVYRQVAEFFGSEPCAGIESEHVVSMGASILGNTLLSDYSEESPVLLDVTPLAIGVGTIGDYVEIIVDKNEPLPMERKSIFTNASDNQDTVRVEVYQGDSSRKSSSLLMGELVLSELRKAKRGELKIEVSFDIDTNGVMEVSALDLETGKAQKISMNILGLE